MVEVSRPKQNRANPLIGRCFVNPLFDYLVIGGGLSLITVAVLLFLSRKESGMPGPIGMLPLLFLVSNSAHLAASTVRLYSKPDARKTLPFVTMAMPLVGIGMLTFCIFQADVVGSYIQLLYVMWSPYHYAAQAYGLGVMYSYRSGCMLSPANKKLFFWISILPFFYVNLDIAVRHLLPRFVPETLIASEPRFGAFIDSTVHVLGVLALLLPLVLYLKVWLSKSGPMPLISLLVVSTNGIWWVIFSLYDAVVWATVFHGVQYIAIVTIFHAKDQCSRPGNAHSAMFHIGKFYLSSVLLGYGLIYCWPQAYILTGFGPVESVLLVVAAINIHHFIVDGYIWRLQKGDSNRRVVDSTAPAPAAAMGV